MKAIDYIKGIRHKVYGRHLLTLSSFLTTLFVAMLFFAGCHDDVLGIEPDRVIEESDEDCIAFTIQLDKSISTRGASPLTRYTSFTQDKIDIYDDYIDTQDKFRVFFFTEEGDFLFGATDRVLGSIKQTSDNSANYWYVRIPMSMLVDRENQEYDIEKIKSYLKNHPFKVAALANWPNGGEKVNPADWDDSEGTQDTNSNPSSTLKGNPHWNWSNSILNQDAKAEDIRNINDLHHVYNDKYYASSSHFGSYGQFMAPAKYGDEPGYYMGEPTDWVKMRDIEEGWKNPGYNRNLKVPDFDSKESANAWIRANCTPNVDINQDKKIYRHYQHLWFLWNFNAAYLTGDKEDNIGYLKDGTTNEEVRGNEFSLRATDESGNYTVLKVYDPSAYHTNFGWKDNSPVEDDQVVSPSFAEEWYKRNGDRLYQWMKKSYNNGGAPQAIGGITIDIGESNNDVIFNYLQRTGEPAYCVKVGNYYGIQLPPIGKGENDTYTGMMNFRARTSGTLRIKWGSRDGTSSGLAVQVDQKGQVNETTRENTTIYREQSGVTSRTPVNWKDPSTGMEYLDISINEDSKPVYIFCTTGKAVVYSVEFIRGQYLYATDREGVAPSKEQGIPMYGVRQFEGIKDWQRGTTHNLEGNISLIRSLAKVEVFIKTSFGEPRHMYMRCMNRAARCEPIDVHTSTDFLWSDIHSTTSTDETGISTDDKPCEWFRIQQYGPAYQQSESSYPDWLSWFYGSWTNHDTDKYPAIYWKSDNNSANYKYDYNLGYWVSNGERTGWKGSNFSYNTTLEPPHIFNPYIYRSDFCRFLYVGEEGEYRHYVLYMPEKYIDDPSTVGNVASTPKVPHIEYRFHPKGNKDSGDDSSPQITEEEIAGVAADPYSNSEYNLDDNDCYRIYFTNYGFSSTSQNNNNVDYVTDVNPILHDKKVSNSTYDTYEQNRENLKYHWPIMRNHSYKLYVGGSGPENPEIHVQISDWGHRKVIVEW